MLLMHSLLLIHRRTEYELFGVLVHAGYTLLSGHYYSFLKVNSTFAQFADLHPSCRGIRSALVCLSTFEHLVSTVGWRKLCV